LTVAQSGKKVAAAIGYRKRLGPTHSDCQRAVPCLLDDRYPRVTEVIDGDEPDG
jgi:hypothetical protein